MRTLYDTFNKYDEWKTSAPRDPERWMHRCDACGKKMDEDEAVIEGVDILCEVCAKD